MAGDAADAASWVLDARRVYERAYEAYARLVEETLAGRYRVELIGVVLGTLGLLWSCGGLLRPRPRPKRASKGVQARVLDSFASSRMYEQAVEKTFDEIDSDGSGSIDETELYVGVLLIFDRINRRLPTHETPPARAVVEKLLREHDADGSKKLDREEFMALAKALLDPTEGGSASGMMRRIVQNVLWTTVLAPMFAYALRAVLAMAAGSALGASWSTAVQTYVPIAVVAPVISVAVTMNARAERGATPIPVRRRGGGASGHRQSRRR